jgi:hypothetical protein
MEYGKIPISNVDRDEEGRQRWEPGHGSGAHGGRSNGVGILAERWNRGYESPSP